MIKYRVFAPDDLRPGYDGELIVTTNPALSTADGHTADSAEQIAHLLQVPVMVFPRPYTNEDAKISWSRYAQTKKDAMPKVNETAEALNSAIEMETDGLGDVCFAGHSAAGAFLIAVAATGRINRLKWLYATDPPAIRENNQLVYAGRYISETSADFVRPWFTGVRPDADNINHAAKPSSAKMAQYLVQEWLVHSGFISSDQCLRWMIACAEQQTDTAVNIRFPARTFTAGTAWHLAIKSTLEGLDRPAPFEVTVGAERYHADYINNTATAQHISRLMFPSQQKA